jgi:tRNA1Val (adenine37-N6)-methyltransferase
MSTFHFKHFTVRQIRSAMKVGTDAMLLGALCRFGNLNHLLDIGTGTGVLSLMAAQRFQPEKITAVEIDPPAAEDALYNFGQARFPTKFTLVRNNLLDWEPEHLFDGIITNPPYFEQSYKSHSEQRNLARHTDELPFPELMQWCSRFLSPEGLLWMIVPSAAEPVLIAAATRYDLFPNEIITVNGKPDTPVRVVLCFAKTAGDIVRSTATVRNADGTYTDEYIRLTRDFHSVDLSLQSR